MRTSRLRATLATALAALTIGALVAVAAPPASAAYCGQVWGSLPEHAGDMSGAVVTDVRSGRHSCFDRLVIDLNGDVIGHHVAYVSQVVADGSGDVVPTAGGARLSVTVTAATYDGNYRVRYAPRDPQRVVDVSGYGTFRQVSWAGSFEGNTTFGLGVRARLPFRVFTLDGPGDGSRLVVDVAHRW